MAQIKRRRTKDGADRYTAVIRIKREGVIVHQEAQTFPRRAQAEDWSRRREVALSDPGALERVRQGDVSIKALIERYVTEFEGIAKWSVSKANALAALRETDIAKQSAINITSQRLVKHIQERRKAGAGPATAGNDLMWLGSVFKAAKGAWGIPTALEELWSAKETCRRLKLTAQARRRDRTPTYDELKMLDEHFERIDRSPRCVTPLRHLMWFAIYSARREAEITRLQWADNDDARHLGIVRDAKHPTRKDGNHRTFRYTPQAWAIVQMQPRTGPFIFPYDPPAIRERFQDTCRFLGIRDLRFHDLRHEAVTRLFERGLSIPDVAAHSLHETWGTLKRYTHLVRRDKTFNAPFLPKEP